MSIGSTKNGVQYGTWSELPLDIISLIVNQEQLSLADVGRMATVCKSWDSILRENNWFGLHVNANIGKTPFPWLMLADECRSGGKRGFFNPATGQVSEVYLPEAEGRRCCGSSHGWIVTIGEDMEINLLNPLTRQQLSLPSQLTFDVFSDGSTNQEIHEWSSRKDVVRSFILKAILTCSPSRAGECVTVASLFPPGLRPLAYARPGDSKWTIIPHLESYQEPNDFIFYQGQVFAINLFGELMVLDLYHDPELKWKVISPELYDTCRDIFGGLGHCHFDFYLAQIAGKFVAVVRGAKVRERCRREILKVAVFKFQLGEWRQIHEIGDCCLFLGVNQTICLSPAPRGYRPNCIYFADDFHFYFRDSVIPVYGLDTLIYSTKSDDFSPVHGGVSLSDISPPLWLTLNFSG